MYFDVTSFADSIAEKNSLVDENNFYDMVPQVDKEIYTNCGNIDKMYEEKNHEADLLFSKGTRTVKKVKTKTNSIKRVISYEQPKAAVKEYAKEHRDGMEKMILKKQEKAQRALKTAKANIEKETKKAKKVAEKESPKVVVFSRKSIEKAKTAKLDSFTKEVGLQDVANKTQKKSKEIGIKHKRGTGRDDRP